MDGETNETQEGRFFLGSFSGLERRLWQGGFSPSASSLFFFLLLMGCYEI